MFLFKAERIYLKDADEDIYLDTYAVNDKTLTPRDAILVIPGGGYGHVCLDREGEKTALAYLARGVNAFVLNYSIGEDAVFPAQLECAALAMAYIKKHAEEYNVNPERVFSLGFSAGGHLAGLLTTMHGFAEERFGLEKDMARPRGTVFCYPVISAFPPTNRGTIENLLKKSFDSLTDEERLIYSIETNIKSTTPPAFMWHTATDAAVPVQGTLKLALAYANAGASFTLRVYPYGPHGIALGTDYSNNGKSAFVQPMAEKWLEESIEWMKTV